MQNYKSFDRHVGANDTSGFTGYGESKLYGSQKCFQKAPQLTSSEMMNNLDLSFEGIFSKIEALTVEHSNEIQCKPKEWEQELKKKGEHSMLKRDKEQPKPNKEWEQSKPTKEWEQFKFKKDWEQPKPNKEWEQPKPTKEWEQFKFKKDWEQPKPTKEWEQPKPNQEWEQFKPNKEWEQFKPNKEWEQPKPTKEWEQPKPNQEWEQPKPTKEWEQPKPTKEWEQFKPNKEWEQPKPTKEWEQPKPTKEWEQPKPNKEWEQPKPTKEWEQFKFKKDWEQPKPTKEWEQPKPNQEWEQFKPNKEWEQFKPNKEWEQPKPNKEWEQPKPTKDWEEYQVDWEGESQSNIETSCSSDKALEQSAERPPESFENPHLAQNQRDSGSLSKNSEAYMNPFSQIMGTQAKQEPQMPDFGSKEQDLTVFSNPYTLQNSHNAFVIKNNVNKTPVMKASINIPEDDYNNNSLRYKTQKLDQVVEQFSQDRRVKKSICLDQIIEESNFKISQFELGKCVGSGKFGDVFVCRHRQTGFLFALKKIFKSTILEYQMVNQFTRELRIHYSLDHPNIIKLYTHFDDEYHIFLLMEYAEGGILMDKLKSTEDETSRYVAQAIRAVEYLHKNEIAHRDIKPENIVLQFNDVIKMCDFGWSSFIGNEMKTTFCGTLDYLSPEMKEKGQYDFSIDLWSLGILTFELLVGSAPFKDEISSWKKQNGTRSDKWNWNINYPSFLSDLSQSFMRSLLKENPEDRSTLRLCSNHEFIRRYQKSPKDNVYFYSCKRVLE